MNTRLLFIFLLIGGNAFGQNTFSISGTIRDKTETLPGASVYISGYKIVTVTNNEGKFILPNLQPGSYDILVQMIGYLPLSKNIVITDKAMIVDLKLKENTTLLNEVVIKPDPNRTYYLQLFKDFFIGKTPNAEQCKILNTNVILIDGDEQNRAFTVKASDFLIIENEALGYRIKYLLERFEYNFTTKILFYAGYPTFEEMKGSQSKQKNWAKNRQTAYQGSSLHFFKALYHNKVDEEGFIIHKRYQMPNPDRLSDSLINANLKRLMRGQPNENLPIDAKWNKLSINDWLRKKKEPKTLNIINREKVATDTLVKTVNSSIKVINFKDELFVINKNEREPTSYIGSSDYQSRPKDIVNFQISVIKVFSGPIYFYANGVTANPNSTLYSGYWSFEKMADTVPIDFVSTLKKSNL